MHRTRTAYTDDLEHHKQKDHRQRHWDKVTMLWKWLSKDSCFDNVSEEYFMHENSAMLCPKIGLEIDQIRLEFDKWSNHVYHQISIMTMMVFDLNHAIIMMKYCNFWKKEKRANEILLSLFNPIVNICNFKTRHLMKLECTTKWWYSYNNKITNSAWSTLTSPSVLGIEP